MITPRNILIVRTDRIGDVVLSLPVAKIIKKHYPESKITFLLSGYTAPLAENHPYIDDIIVIKEKDGKASINENISILKNNGYDTCITVHPTFRLALILFLSSIKNRIGTGYRWYSLLFNKKIYEHRKYGKIHELEHNINLLKKMNIEEKIDKDNVSFDIQVSRKTEQLIAGILRKEGITGSKPIVIVHPGSGGSAVDLPIERMKEIVELLARELIVDIIVTGSDTERNICEYLSSHAKVKNFAGRFDLDELKSLINQCDVLIANSTGPIHIAAALNKFVVGFYPKIASCSPVRWGPYTRKSAVFTPGINCKNCTRKQCEELDCMNTINSRDAVDAVAGYLGAKEGTK